MSEKNKHYLPGELQRNLDEAETVSIQIAKMISGYYHELCNNGVPDHHAIILANSFQNMITGGAIKDNE